MSDAQTLGQLIQDVRDQADVVGAGVRHDDTLLTRLINKSIKQFRSAITRGGATQFLSASNGTLTAGVTSPYSFGRLDISSIADFVRSHGLDVTINDEPMTLRHVSFDARNDYGNTAGVPVAWTHYTRTDIALFPAPDAAYAYTLWYLPKHTDLSDLDNDSFDGVSGWEDYVVWDVVSRVIMRDQFPAAFQMAESKRAVAMSKILREARETTDQGGGVIGRDTFAERHNGVGRRRMLPPP